MTLFTELALQPATQAALSAMGMTTPTPIQAATLPPLLAGSDLIGQARTGSGKTLAFGIPLIERIDSSVRGVQALVLTPTRELATQVGGVLTELSKGRSIRTTLIYGGRPFGPQEAALRAGTQVVVGAPGRVLDLIRRGSLDLGRVRYLVLDEADEMLDRGFAPDVERILARIPRDRQTALFSATVPPWVGETGAKYLRQPVSVRIDTRPEDAPTIEHSVYDVPEGAKLDVLKSLLDARGDGSTIVFGRTKHGVKKLGKQLEILGYPVAALQGNLSQNARDRVMEDFRRGTTRILLATNVAARGIDVESVEQVINFDLPESAELLTHRVGRTGRMGRAGRAITLLAPEDGPKWRQLERSMVRKLPRQRWRAEFAGATTTNGPAHVVPQPSAPLTAAPLPVAAGTPARESSRVLCAACGREAVVPFVPSNDRPVYCRDCYRPRSAPAAGRPRQPVGQAPVNGRLGGPRRAAESAWRGGGRAPRIS